MLKGKHILLGVTGGIAAYKACDLVSRLKKLHADVKVMMTRSAAEFVAPLTFQSLSQNPVAMAMFDAPQKWEIEHIALAQWADLMLIAPATANILGKLAGGIADDLLTTTVMATRAPLYIAPAMNTQMLNHPLVQANIRKLKKIDAHFIAAESGRLACGDVGDGKLAAVETLVETVVRALAGPRDYSGRRVLITAGPTRESIDPVRYLSNHSSGKMGYALARAAVTRGAEVTLVSGPVALEQPCGLNAFIAVESAVEMHRAVTAHFPTQDVVIMAAAVADFKPKHAFTQKIKKSDTTLTIEFEKNVDILAELGRTKTKQRLIGFAAETKNLEDYARQKLLSKNLDLIVANDLTLEGAGFGVDTNIVKLIDRTGTLIDIPMMSKSDLSQVILDTIKTLF